MRRKKKKKNEDTLVSKLLPLYVTSKSKLSVLFFYYFCGNGRKWPSWVLLLSGSEKDGKCSLKYEIINILCAILCVRFIVTIRLSIHICKFTTSWLIWILRKISRKLSYQFRNKGSNYLSASKCKMLPLWTYFLKLSITSYGTSQCLRICVNRRSKKTIEVKNSCGHLSKF